MPVRSAIAWPNDKLYLFFDDRYTRIDSTTGAVEATDQALSNWPGLPASPTASLYWGYGKAYFFLADSYVRYSLDQDAVEDWYLPPNPPRTLAEFWPGIWTDGIDAALNWGNGKCYLFRGSQYIRWDMVSNRADANYPRDIGPAWSGVWPDRVDAAVYQGGAFAYFFRDDEWRRFNLASDTVDASGSLASFAPAPVPSGSLTAARHLTLTQANVLMADLIRRGLLTLKSWTPFVDGPQGIVSPRPADRVAVEPKVVNGVTFTSVANTTVNWFDNIDQRFLIALYRLTRWMNGSTPNVSEIRHMGMGHGNGPDTDCHNQGRAIDLSGLIGDVSGTPFSFEVQRDWGNLSPAASGLKLDNADPTAQLLFRTAYRFGMFEGEANGIGTGNTWPAPDLGGRGYLIYPDYGGDAALRAAHQNHMHIQVGPTRA